MKLPKYAEAMGIHRVTALRWFHEGKLPHPAKQISPRIIMVEVEDDFDGITIDKSTQPGKTVGYVRVSTRKQIDSLPHQKLAILEYANAHGITVHEVVEEVGSGFNENRKKLSRILSNRDITTIIVEHRDRLARSNFNLIQQTLKAQGREILVIEDDELQDDLITEITEFMVSAAGRLYGKRGAQSVKSNLETAHKEIHNEK